MGCLASKPKVLAAECVPLSHGAVPAPQAAPSEEQSRPRSLRELGIRGTQPNLDSLLNLLRSVLQVEQALVVLNDKAGRLSYPAQSGELSAAPRDQVAGCHPAASLCEWALASSGRGLLVIVDVLHDARLMDQPATTREGGVRLFVGTPLVAPDTGLKHGMLCLLDSRPRHIPAERLSAVLANFSEMVTRELEREKVMHSQQEQLQASVRHARAMQVLERYKEAACLVDCSTQHWPILCANAGWTAVTGLALGEAGLQPQAFFAFFAVCSVGPPLQGKPLPLPASSASSPVASIGSTPMVASQGSSAPVVATSSSSGKATSSGQGSSIQLSSTPGVASQASSGQASSGQGSSGSIVPAWRQGNAEQEARFAAGSRKPFCLVASLSSLAAGGSSATGGKGGGGLYVFSFTPCSTAEEKLLGGGAAGGRSSHQSTPGGHSALPGAVTNSNGDGGESRVPLPAELQLAPPAGSATAAEQPRYFLAFVERQQQQGTLSAAMQTVVQPGMQEVPHLMMQPMVQPGLPSEGSLQPNPTLTGAGPCMSLSLGSAASGECDYTRLHIPMPSEGLADKIAEVSALETLPELMADVQLGPLIGTGAFGHCYRGTWQGNRVAVKVLECIFEPGSDEAAFKGGILEALISRSLSHPHVVETYSYAIGPKSRINDKVHQQVWIVQAYCNKGPLLSAVEKGKLRGEDGRPHLTNILRTACDIAGAMAYLHASGVVHGDLSLNNVLCTTSLKDSRKWVAKVADFGLSRALSGGAVHTTSLRTVTHMPRELLRYGILSPAVDVYSFGVQLWEMWAGERAWKGATAMQVISAVTLSNISLQVPSDAPPELQDIMRGCLAPEPGDRPSFKELFNALSAQLQQAKQADAGASSGPSPAPGPSLVVGSLLASSTASAAGVAAEAPREAVGGAAEGSGPSSAAGLSSAGAACSTGRAAGPSADVAGDSAQ